MLLSCLLISIYIETIMHHRTSSRFDPLLLVSQESGTSLSLPWRILQMLVVCIQLIAELIYWAKVLTDHPKNCNNVFVVQYFGRNFVTFNRAHQLESGILHAVCACVNAQNL